MHFDILILISYTYFNGSVDMVGEVLLIVTVSWAASATEEEMAAQRVRKKYLILIWSDWFYV